MADSSSQELVKANREEWLQEIKESYESIFDKLDESEKKLLTKQYSKSKYGFYDSIAMICADDCPVRGQCPLYKIAKHPLGDKCPIEQDFLHYHITKYAEEFGLDPRVHSEMIMLTELAECIIYEDRLTKQLAMEAKDLLLKTEKFSPSGDSWMEMATHPAFVTKEKIKARRLKIIESMAGTRKEKVKLIKTAAKVVDYSAMMSNIRAALDKKIIKNEEIKG